VRPDHYTLSLHDALPIFRFDPKSPHQGEGKETVFSMRCKPKYLQRIVGIAVTILLPLLAPHVVGAQGDSEAGGAVTGTIAYLQRDRKSTRLNSSHVKISY